MTTKSAGQIAYEARFPHAGGRHGEKLWKEQSRDVHALWDRIAEAVRLKIIEPVPGWRESGAEDPHGTRYDCPRDRICGGHLTDDQVAFAVAMADRSDLRLEGVLSIAKDRIRWLSRQLHAVKTSLEATVRDANGMREELALRASKITALEADLDALEHRRRWNVMEGRDGSVLICQNLHAKHEPCDYIEYVPAERLERLQVERTFPPFGLPPGSLQAYSDAYKAARNGPNHLDAHIAGLRAVLEHDPDFAEVAEAPTPYTVLATIYDGTQILAPATLSDRYSHEEISAAIKDLVARARGPRSGDMADVVDAINGEAGR